jgi:hypothetical protein
MLPNVLLVQQKWDAMNSLNWQMVVAWDASTVERLQRF